METDDPFLWSAEEVAHFFRHDIPYFIHNHGLELHEPNLPPTENLAQQLHLNELNGSYLLQDIDRAFLKTEFNIATPKHQFSVMQIIRTLRRISPGYSMSQEPAHVSQHSLLTPHASVPHTPATATNASVTAIRTPTVVAEPLAAVVDHPAVGSRIRKGETAVEDQNGRKRRRLNLAPAIDAPLPIDQAEMSALPSSPQRALQQTDTISGYLRDKKLTVDEIFYGDTEFGEELKHAESTSEDDLAYENFTIVGQSNLVGNSAFVYRKIHHALQNNMSQHISYHGQPAVAIYPYQEQEALEKVPRSVTVFQATDKGVKAVRENGVHLAYQRDETVVEQVNPGDEWSFLLKKYSSAKEAELLPVYGESETDETPAGSPIGSGSDSGSDDMAEEDDTAETTTLTLDLVLAAIDRIVESQAQNWRQVKQPKLELKRARSVWRQAKGIPRDIKALKKECDMAITRLTTRLDQLKNNLTKRTWDNEHDLEQACEILEPTVYDREYEQWKSSVWERKQEPAPDTRSHKSSAKERFDVSAPAVISSRIEDDDMHDFVEEDSFEDARERLSDGGANGEHGNEDGYNFEEDNVVEEDEGLEDNAFSDEEDVVRQDQKDDDEHEMSEPVSTPSSHHAQVPNRSATGNVVTLDEDTDDEPEVPGAFEHDDNPFTTNRSLERMDVDELPPDVVHVDEKLPETPTKLAFMQPESPFLPSPSTFQPRPSQPSATKNILEPIVISSSPPASAKLSPAQSAVVKKKSIKREPTLFSNDPYTDDPIDIINRDYSELEDNRDRPRLMVKMAFELEEHAQNLLRPFLITNMTACLRGTKAAVEKLNLGEEEFSDDKPEESETLRYAGRLYKCWVHLDHKLFTEDVSVLAEQPWKFEDEYEFDSDIRAWHTSMKRSLQMVEKFSKGKESKQIEFVVIDDDQDNEDEQELGEERFGKTPRSKRKRAIKQDQTAATKRARAAERAAAYESQNQGSQLMTSFAADGDEEAVPLYAPDDVEEAKHVYLNPEIAKRLKPHQIEGVKFMWREITAPADEDGQGCLLAHTMGLGKTAQSLALISAIAETVRCEKRECLPDDLLKAKKKFRVLILCPPSLIQNWKQEIEMWCPDKLFDVYKLTSEVSSKASRLDDIRNWRNDGGIMLCGYSMFAKLVHGKISKINPFTEDEQKEVTQHLLKRAHVIIADEVHQIKKSTSQMSKAAHMIKSVRRIGLTGSPMSNNTSEIFALINWVAPGFLGSEVEFRAHYEEPIVDGTYIESTTSEIRTSMRKLEALKRIIAPKLNRADITVLKGSLKSKVEFVLTIPLTDPQRLGYHRYVEEILRDKADEEGTSITQAKIFGWLAILQLLCNHPKVFRDKLLEPKETKSKKGSKLSLAPAEDEIPAGTATEPSSTAIRTPSPDTDTALADEHVSKYDINKAMIDRLLEAVPAEASIELSYKTLLVQRIMSLSLEAGDKVLIFSQSIPSLNFLSSMLTNLGARFGCIQGSMPQDKREKVLRQMQAGELDVMLISTRAGGLGLNIQQANRVIIFDFAFNPTWEEQAIGRAYRLGQTKPVFVYRFVAGGTFERSMYNKQLFKTSLTKRVVDKKNPVRNTAKKPSEWLYAPKNISQGDIVQEMGKDEHVLDKIILAHSEGEDSFIRNIKTMKTLMEESKDAALTADELAEVQKDVEDAKIRKRSGFADRPTLGPLPPRSGTQASASHLPSGTQMANADHPLTGMTSSAARKRQEEMYDTQRQLFAASASRIRTNFDDGMPPDHPLGQHGSPGTPSRIHGRY